MRKLSLIFKVSVALASVAAVVAVGCGEPAADPAVTDTSSDDTGSDPVDSTTQGDVEPADVGATDAGSAVEDTSESGDSAGEPETADLDSAGSGSETTDETDTSNADTQVIDAGPLDTYDPLQLNDTTVAPAPTCDAWCAAMNKSCAKMDMTLGGAEADKLFADAAKCTAWCKATPKWQAGKTGHALGNTISCRTHHATEAAGGMAAAHNHCPAAGLSGGGVCGTYCENYCHWMQTLCPTTYKKASDCNIECKGVLSEYDGKVDCLISTVLNLPSGTPKCAEAEILNGKTKACNQKLPDAAATVKTQGISFLPKEVTVTVGESVLFGMPQGHNAVEVSQNEWDINGNKALPGGFVVPFGKIKLVTFNKVGLVHYVCQVHANLMMKGRVTVKAAKGP